MKYLKTEKKHREICPEKGAQDRAHLTLFPDSPVLLLRNLRS